MYARLDDGFFHHPKVLETSFVALALYALGLSYAQRYLTDGRLTRAAVRFIGRGDPAIPSLTEELVRVRLWDQDGDDYCIHNFLRHNMSRVEIEAMRGGTRERMRAFRSRIRDAVTPPVTNAVRAALVPGVGHVADAPSRALRQNPRSKALPTAPKLSADATSTDHAASFSQFWECYPPRNGRRDKKAQAYAAWVKLAPDAALEARILHAVRRYAQANPLPVDAVRYLVHRRWEDEADVAFVASRPPRAPSPAALIPDAKPIRSPEAIATVRDVLEKLPFMRGRL